MELFKRSRSSSSKALDISPSYKVATLLLNLTIFIDVYHIESPWNDRWL